MDEKLLQLAENIVDYSLKTHAGENCLIWGAADARELLYALGEQCRARGAYPIYIFYDDELVRQALLALAAGQELEEIPALMAQQYYHLLDHADSFVAIRSKLKDNPFEGVPPQAVTAWQKHLGAIFARFTSETKWVVFDWPTQLQADKLGMGYEEFYAYVMALSAMDYAGMNRAAQPLKALLEKTDRVHIKGAGTDLRFSIKDINVIIGTAENSYIDGEVYTAPVKDSIEGQITYTIPSLYMGQTFERICFQFEHGRIVRATCEKGDPQALNHILDTDEGSRYIGEFALGINPLVTKPMNDIHYDEKMITSFHLTPGNSYTDAPNGNSSAIHWDLVCDQSPRYGGGEIWFDGLLVKKDGRFLPDDLQGLYDV